MAFSGPARANAYGPHTGLSLMVLQRKRLQGRTGHMIINIIIIISLGVVVTLLECFISIT